MYHSVLELCRHRNLWGDSGPGACPGTLAPSSHLYLVSDTDWCAFPGLGLVRRGVRVHLSHSPYDSGLGVAVPRLRRARASVSFKDLGRALSNSLKKILVGEGAEDYGGQSRRALGMWGARGDGILK